VRQRTPSFRGVGGSDPPLPAKADVRLEHGGASPLRVRGTSTGRTYLFTAAERVQPVDPNDAPMLLQSGLFSRAVERSAVTPHG